MTTNLPELMRLWPSTIIRQVRRWWIRRQIANINYTLKHIAAQRENDRHAERVLMGRQAVLRSDLHSI